MLLLRMKLPEDIKKDLHRRFMRRHQSWLRDGESGWPFTLSLGVPTEQIAKHQIEYVRAWVTAWQKWRGPGTLSWCERRWSTLGTQRLPDKLILETPHMVADWVGETARWQLARARYQSLVETWPILIHELSSHFDVLADYTDADFKRLNDLLHWLVAHPKSNLYPRQLPIPGIDSKWLETHKKSLVDLLAMIQGESHVYGDFFKRCGLKSPPRLVRFRILDAHLRQACGGLSDISAPLEDIAALALSPQQVIIVENLQTGLAFGDSESTVVFMGLGYAVDVLSFIPWLKSAKCYYWGDIDTHGFAILNGARQHLPQLQSIFMDNITLQHCQALWGKEDKPHRATTLAYLTAGEQVVYQSLHKQVGRVGEYVRLEQERIPWDYVEQCLSVVVNLGKFNAVRR